jgi:hypothetical protein
MWKQAILAFALALIVVASFTEVCVCAEKDLVLRGVSEAAIDLPRVLFMLKRQADGPALGPGGRFEVNYAFLDTGGSGILLSRETANLLGVGVEPNARFVDIGIGGDEYFDVSEPLYIGLADYEEKNPRERDVYKVLGPGRVQVKQEPAGILGQPLDIMGVPVMAGRIVVLNSGATNDLGHFAAEIKEPGDPSIPKVDLTVALRFENFLNPNNPKNIPPLPSLSHNPVIDNIVIGYRGKRSKGNWLFDTGATISFISTDQAKRISIMDKNGRPLLTQAFSVPVGGVGAIVQIPGFEIDELTVPTLSGRNLVYDKPRLGVHDITYFDEDKEKFVTLDGVFGSNFLCATVKMEDLFSLDIGKTAFEKIVLDMRQGLLGFDINDGYRGP